MGKLPINGSFSIAMLVYQRVDVFKCLLPSIVRILIFHGLLAILRCMVLRISSFGLQMLANIPPWSIRLQTSEKVCEPPKTIPNQVDKIWFFSTLILIFYLLQHDYIWVWVNTRYIFSGLFTSINPSYDLGFTRGTRLLTHPQSAIALQATWCAARAARHRRSRRRRRAWIRSRRGRLSLRATGKATGFHGEHIRHIPWIFHGNRIWECWFQ